MKSLAPVRFPSPAESHALVLEFQRIAARLTQAGILSSASSTRLMRTINHRRSRAETIRRDLSELVFDVLTCIEDGALQERHHYLRTSDGIALHLESTASLLSRARGSTLRSSEMRRLLHFGRRFFPEIVTASSKRMHFGPSGARRRTVEIDVRRAYEFVGGGPPPASAC